MSNIQDIITDELQYMVQEYENIHGSIIDQMTKLTDYCSRLNRSIAKACTQCGCVQISASKQNYTNATNISLSFLDTHCTGVLCPDCKELVEKHMGSTLYYLAALCNSLDMNLYDVILKELDKIDLLRKYNIE